MQRGGHGLQGSAGATGQGVPEGAEPAGPQVPVHAAPHSNIERLKGPPE